MKMKMNKKTITSMLALSATACLSLGVSAITASAGNGVVDTYGLTATDAFEICGAGIRFAEDDQTSGIRFAVGIEKSVYETMQAADVLKDVKILLMPTAFVNGELEVDESYTANGVTVTPTGGAVASEWKLSDDGKYMMSYAYIYQVPAEFFNREISARAYYMDGETPIYSEVTDKDSRSVAQVASLALEDVSDTYDEKVYSEEVIIDGVTKYSPYSATRRALLDAYSMSWDFQTGDKTIYSTNVTLAGKEYSNTVTYVLNATHRGEAVTPTWVSEDETIVTVNNGVVTAVGVGTTNIYAQYTVEVEGETKTYTSAKRAVTVEMSTIETNKELVFGAQDSKNPIALSEITEDAGFAISGILNAADNTAIAYENGNVTASLTEGKYEWIIHNGEYGYKVNAYVATNVIREASDLAIFDYSVASNTFEGTYVLANNIDASEYEHYKTQYNNTKNNAGLMGTFDGRGYTIDGITLYQAGLFGTIGGTGVIKNVAFTNVTLSGQWAVVFARSLWYAGVIENVFIEIEGWENVDGLSLITAPLYIHNKANANSRIENVMVVMPEVPTTISSKNAVGSLVGVASDVTPANNTYVLSPIETKISSVTNYGSVADFKSNVNVSELDFGDIWDLTGEYPVFKTSEKVAPYTI